MIPNANEQIWDWGTKLSVGGIERIVQIEQTTMCYSFLKKLYGMNLEAHPEKSQMLRYKSHERYKEVADKEEMQIGWVSRVIIGA